MQLLSPLNFVNATEYSILLGMRASLSQCLRVLMYGFNDCTVPPVAILPHIQQYSGLVRRPKIVLNWLNC